MAQPYSQVRRRSSKPQVTLRGVNEPVDTALMRGVVRTIGVLRALNSHNGARVSDLSSATGIPRPSLYRVLDTLAGLGYVRRRLDSERYELTFLVRTLSDGFRDEDWIRSIGIPVIEQLQKTTVWPAELSTFLHDAMRLRETTRPNSPLTIDHQAAGWRVPMLMSAAGRAYLAYCPDAVREEILANLRTSLDPHDACVRDPRYVRNVIARTRRNGYGERHGEVFPKTGAIAVPIVVRTQVICCLSITFIASAMTPREAAARYLEPMREAAATIATGLTKNKAAAIVPP